MNARAQQKSSKRSASWGQADVSAWSDMQAELEASRERYVELYDHAPIGYVTLTRSGCIQEINLTGAAMLGRPREQLVNSPLLHYIAQSERRAFLRHLNECHRGNAERRVELPLRVDNGTEQRFIELLTVPFRSNRNSFGFRSAMVDITKRKRAEEALRFARQELEHRVAEQSTLLKLLPVGVLIGDRECRHVLGNPAAYEILGLKPGQDLSLGVPPQEALKGVRARVDGAEIQSVSDLPMQRVARTGKPLKNIKHDIIYSDGRVTSIHASIAPLHDEQGRVRSVLAAYADTTKRDQAEQAIRMKESQLRLITDVAPVMLTQCSRDLRYQYVNRAYAHFLGKRPEQIIGRHIGEIVGETALKVIRPQIELVLQGRRVEFEQNLEYHGVGWRFIRASYAPDRDENGKVVGWVAALLDISERKQEEKRLAASHEITRVLAESPALETAMPRVLEILCRILNWDVAVFWVLNAEGKYLQCHTAWHQDDPKLARFSAACRRSKWFAGERMPGDAWLRKKWSWISNLPRERRFKRAESAASAGLNTGVVFPVLFGDKFHGAIEFFARATRKEDEKFLHLLTNLGSQIGQFITRKHGEESLRESEARFRELADSAPVLIWMAGTDKKYIYFNQRWLDFTGRTLKWSLGEELKGIHPQDLKRYLTAYHNAFKSRQEFEIEYRLRRRDDEYVWLLDHGAPRFTAGGEFLGYIGSCVDISARKAAEESLRAAQGQLEARVRERTAQLSRANAALEAEIAERKLTEAALRESEERFRLMIEGVQDCAVFMLDPKGNVATWNNAARRLHGWRTRDIVGRHLSLFYTAADVSANVPRQFLAAAADKGRAEHEGWRLRKSGAQFWASVLLTALRDDSGKLRGFSVVTRDITERRRAQTALDESRARLQAIMDNSPALIFLKDLRGRYLHCNRPFEQLVHLSPEKIIGKTDLEIFPREQAWRFRANDRAVVRAKRPLAFDEVAQHDDGPHTSIVTKFPLFDTRGNIYAIGGVATDITPRLRAEQALRRSEEIMADLFERSPLGLFWVNPKGNLTRVNKAGLDLLACTPAQCLEKPIANFLTDRYAATDALKRLSRGEVLLNHRVRMRGRDGKLRHVLIDANGLWDGGKLLHSRWFARDITRRVELEREILAASERERQRIGRDLHDDLCQQLAGIEFLSQSLGKQLPPEMPEQSRRAREIARMIREAITHTRELAHGLSPTPLDSAGLCGALQELTERARKLFKVDCRLSCKPGIVVEDEAVTFHLYRIAQEAVNNAIKHGRARKIEIALLLEAGRVILRVRDFGLGMKSKRADVSGMGLRVMQYRAGVIGGTLNIEETAGGGTTIVCSLPEYLVKTHSTQPT